MCTISLETRAMKDKSPDAMVKVRFRVLGGRNLQLSVKTDIKASVRDLSKFQLDGHIKRGVSIFNRDLKYVLDAEMKVIEEAFHSLRDEGFSLTSESLKEKIEEIKHPGKVERISSPVFIERFRGFIESKKMDISIATQRDYEVTYGILSRFLIINGWSEIKCMDFGKIHLDKFRFFCRDEYQFVDKYRFLYLNFNQNNIPTAPRGENTIVSKFKKLRAFFSELERNDEIVKNPFRRLGERERRQILCETYEDDVVALSFDELQKVRDADLPDSLQETRDAFLLQCYIGARISDFQRFSLEDVRKSDGGFFFLAYTPQKTSNKRIEIQTPLVKSAYEIIQRYDFKFSITKYPTGQNGYNAKIRRMLEIVGINREVKVWNEESNKFLYKPVFSVASSKVARKTCVTLCVQNSYYENAAGLHSEKSNAIKHYHDNSLQERYSVFCRAFRESNEGYIDTKKEA